MKTIKISLNSIDKVKTFVNVINRFDAEFDLVSVTLLMQSLSWEFSVQIFLNLSI